MVKPIAIDSHSSNHLSEFSQPSGKLNEVDDAKLQVEKNAASVFPGKENNKDVTYSNSAEIAVAKEKEKEAEEEDLQEAFETVSEFMSLYNRNVNFSLDEQSDKTVIKVFDTDSKELIKQFPSEDLLEMARKIHEVRQDIDLKTGIFLDEKV